MLKKIRKLPSFNLDGIVMADLLAKTTAMMARNIIIKFHRTYTTTSSKELLTLFLTDFCASSTFNTIAVCTEISIHIQSILLIFVS